MSDTEDVRGCPFCGTRPMVDRLQSGRTIIACKMTACYAKPCITGATVPLAHHRWNRRADDRA